ncbi:MAG: hypothetical protein WCD79_12205 [Chthoniobacteraceae bacterium]
MPSQVSIKDGILFVAFTGTVSEADLDKVAVDVLEIENTRPVIPHRISDLTEVTDLSIDFSSILSLAQRRMETVIGNPIKSAIVASKPEHIGFARMFQTVNRHTQITIRIFPDMGAALAWLVES